MLKKVKKWCLFLGVSLVFQSTLTPIALSAQEQNVIFEIAMPKTLNDSMQNTTDSATTVKPIDTVDTGMLDNVTGSALTIENSLINDFQDFETDRYIIKYKNEDSKKKARGAFKGINNFNNNLGFEQKSKKISKNDNFDNIDLIKLNKKEKLKNFINDIKNNNIANDIEYIQPDYQLELSSNDTYYSSQWGLENKTVEDKNIYNRSILYNLEKLPSYLKSAIDKNPELKSFIINTPVDELKKKLVAMDVPFEVEPNILLELANEPALFDTGNVLQSQQIYLCDTEVPEAWDVSQGNNVTVALIDTGIDITHEDLSENIWSNNAEIPENGIDDDENGKIDDVNGWNFTDDNNLVYDQSDSVNENHGTHLAGIISAKKDNEKGIAGVAPSSKIMPLKVFKDGKAYTSDIISAIQYAQSMGIKIVNCSWGSTDNNLALKEAIQNSKMLFVCAAGNNGLNIDNTPIYPAAFNCLNIISVASLNRYGSLSEFSNYGEISVDVAAPGEEIKSTLPNNKYSESSGTSMSAGFVSGEAALILSNLEKMSSEELKEYIFQYSDHLSSLTGKISLSTKINCLNAVNKIASGNLIQISNTSDIESNSQITQTTNEMSLSSASTVKGKFIKVSGGRMHSLSLKSDGTVWACGENGYGQLGDGTYNYRISAVQVSGLTGITSISAGAYHSLALKNDGTVWAWGNNNKGQLGDQTTTTRIIPIQVSGLTGITSISAGDNHSLALKNDGTVWAWGNNGSGQLGDGTNTLRSLPVQIGSLSGITAITAGGFHSLALKNDGTLMAWGENIFGQLGNRSSTSKNIPVQVSDLSGVTAVAAGNVHSIALKNDGTVWAWGYNYYGQLGDGKTNSSSSYATQMIGLSGIVGISANGYNSLALKNDGTVWACGLNECGQLGDGTKVNGPVAIQVSGLSGITCISSGYIHSLAIKDNGTVWAWGDNKSGQLGDGMTSKRITAVKNTGLVGVTGIAAGGYHNLALINDGIVWSWGYNSNGQLGVGTTTDSSTAVKVNEIFGVEAIACGLYHSMALKPSGEVDSWGYNNNGQLGTWTVQDWSLTDKTIPVSALAAPSPTAIDCGSYHSMALKFDGTVWAWGDNSYGQLGNGSTTDSITSVKVSSLSGVTAIAAGGYYSLALKNDGTVWAWGNNSNGQLGNGTTTNSTTIVNVNGLNGIIAIAAGDNYGLALKNDGTVWAWGNNSYGQLGDGTTTNRLTPVQISGLSGVTAITSGSNHNLALKGDGTVWAWGYNGCGQLGDGTTETKKVAVMVSGLSGITKIAAGHMHSLSLKNDGTVWAWGNNYNGQLGIGEKGYSDFAKYSYGTPSIKKTGTITCTAGNKINLILKLKNVKQLTGHTFVITYNTNDIECITDLCKITSIKDTTIGTIAGTGITIIQNDPGIIKFNIEKTVPEGKIWSGLVNIIEFKPKVSGQITLNCDAE